MLTERVVNSHHSVLTDQSKWTKVTFFLHMRCSEDYSKRNNVNQCTLMNSLYILLWLNETSQKKKISGSLIDCINNGSVTRWSQSGRLAEGRLQNTGVKVKNGADESVESLSTPMSEGFVYTIKAGHETFSVMKNRQLVIRVWYHLPYRNPRRGIDQKNYMRKIKLTEEPGLFPR